MIDWISFVTLTDEIWSTQVWQATLPQASRCIPPSPSLTYISQTSPLERLTSETFRYSYLGDLSLLPLFFCCFRIPIARACAHKSGAQILDGPAIDQLRWYFLLLYGYGITNQLSRTASASVHSRSERCGGEGAVPIGQGRNLAGAKVGNAPPKLE